MTRRWAHKLQRLSSRQCRNPHTLTGIPTTTKPLSQLLQYTRKRKETMSLSKLSTELEFRVASFVESDKDLIALAQVTKHYQCVAEESLYKSIELRKEDWVGLRRLLLTLIKRPALALTIKSIDFYGETHDNQLGLPISIPDSEKIREETWNLIGQIRDQIDDFMTYAPQTKKANQIKHEMLSGLLTFQMIDQDPVIPLIICMAKNVKTLTLCCATRMTKDILRMPWAFNKEGCPLGKVKELIACSFETTCRLPLVVLPTMQRLVVLDWQAAYSMSMKQSVVFPSGEPADPMLRVVQFQYSMIKPSYVEGMIRSPWFVNLTELVVSNVPFVSNNVPFPDPDHDEDDEDEDDDEDGDGDGDNDEEDDWPGLIQFLAKYTPKLENLTLTNRFWVSEDEEKIESFRNLKHLKGLAISYDLLAGPGADGGLQGALESLRDMMPHGLQVLALCTFPLFALNALATDPFFKQLEAGAAAGGQDPPAVLKTLVAAIPVKVLRLLIVFVDEEDRVQPKKLPAQMASTLRFAADGMKKLGLLFEVCGDKVDRPLLIGPGFTAPTLD